MRTVLIITLLLTSLVVDVTSFEGNCVLREGSLVCKNDVDRYHQCPFDSTVNVVHTGSCTGEEDASCPLDTLCHQCERCHGWYCTDKATATNAMKDTAKGMKELDCIPRCSKRITATNEGLCRHCYKDTKGIMTIGVGFNLQRADGRKIMAKYGLKLEDVTKNCAANYKTCNQGCVDNPPNCLSQAQILDLYETTYRDFERCIDGWVPGQPPLVRAALIDMSFMGCNKIKQFTNLHNALEASDYEKAAHEVVTSKTGGMSGWCRDVGPRRCSAAECCVRSGK